MTISWTHLENFVTNTNPQRWLLDRPEYRLVFLGKGNIDMTGLDGNGEVGLGGRFWNEMNDGVGV